MMCWSVSVKERDADRLCDRDGKAGISKCGLLWHGIPADVPEMSLDEINEEIRSSRAGRKARNAAKV